MRFSSASMSARDCPGRSPGVIRGEVADVLLALILSALETRPMMRKFAPSLLALSLLLTTAPAALASGSGGAMTIAQIVARSGGTFDDKGYDFDILLTAVQTAGLGTALDDRSAELTVFAPKDRAFVLTARDLGYGGWDEAGAWAFLVDALTGLGGGDPIPVLRNILLYHVAPGALDGATVLASDSIATLLSGASIFPYGSKRIGDNDPDIIDARLVDGRTDVAASNGVIHVIHRVLIPLDI
jgi:serralysin